MWPRASGRAAGMLSTVAGYVVYVLTLLLLAAFGMMHWLALVVAIITPLVGMALWMTGALDDNDQPQFDGDVD